MTPWDGARRSWKSVTGRTIVGGDPSGHSAGAAMTTARGQRKEATKKPMVHSPVLI